MEIRIGKRVFTANLLGKEAPNTCKVIQGILPIKGEAMQVRWSGEAMYVALPLEKWDFTLEPENLTIYGCRGDVLLFSDLDAPRGYKEFIIVYGKAHLRSRAGALRSNLFAEITENLSELRIIGEDLVRKGVQGISIKMLK